MMVIYYVTLFNDTYSVLLTNSLQSLALLPEFEKTSFHESYSPREMNSANLLIEHGSALLPSPASRQEPRSGQCLACSFAESPAQMCQDS